MTAETVNLNKQIDDAEKVALPPPSLDRTFGNDLVAIDANRAGDTFVIVSRGGNQVFRATLDADGKLDILNAAKEQSGLPRPDGQPSERYSHAAGWDTRLRQQRGQFIGHVHERRGWVLPHAAL